jgi:hypothetical protein
LKHRSSADHILVQGNTIGGGLRLGSLRRLIAIPLHCLHKASKQVVMEPTITMLKKAEHIHIDHPGVKIIEPGGGVVADQGGVVGNPLVGDFQIWQDAPCQFIEG